MRHPARAARVLTGGLAVAACAAIVAILAAQGRHTADAATLLQGGEVVEIRVPAGSDRELVDAAVESWRRHGRVEPLPGVHVRIVDRPAHTRSGAS